MQNKSFVDLQVWQKAHTLAVALCQLDTLDQLPHSAAGVAAEIAIGFGQYSHKGKLKFYYQAKDLVLETQSLLLLARDLGLIEVEKAKELMAEYDKLLPSLGALIKAVRGFEQAKKEEKAGEKQTLSA